MEQQLPEFVIAEELVRVTRAVPGVVDVYGGPIGVIATYGRGGRVSGIRVRTDEGQLSIEVHIIAAYAPDLKVPVLAGNVRERIRQQLQAMNAGKVGQIDVAVDDVDVNAAGIVNLSRFQATPVLKVGKKLPTMANETSTWRRIGIVITKVARKWRVLLS